jgi:hypothetical protein
MNKDTWNGCENTLGMAVSKDPRNDSEQGLRREQNNKEWLWAKTQGMAVNKDTQGIGSEQRQNGCEQKHKEWL